MRFNLLPLSLIILFHAAIVLADPLAFERLSVQEGLSHATVYAVAQDRQGFLWFGTEDGLNRYDGYNLQIYRNVPGDSLSLANNNISAIAVDGDGNIWLGTWGGGLDCYNPDTGRFQHHTYSVNDPHSIGSNRAQSLFIDRAGATLWIGTDGGGLNKLSLPVQGNRAEFVKYAHNPDDSTSLSQNAVWTMEEDSAGMLWVGTSNGLNHLDPRTGQARHFYHNPADSNSLTDNRIRKLLFDTAGSLWIGTRSGLNRFNPQTGASQHFLPQDNNPNSLSHEAVNDIFEDAAGRIWIATMRGGLNIYDPQADRFSQYHQKAKTPGALTHDDVRTFFQDRSNVLWIGTRGGGRSKTDLKPPKFQHVGFDSDLPDGLSHNLVWAIYEDRTGRRWIGTDGGLDMWDGSMNLSQGYQRSFRHFRSNPDDPASLSSNQVRAIMEDSAGALWIGTSGGGLNQLDPVTGRCVRYLNDQKNPNSLSNDRVRALFADSGYLWIGTYSGLDRFDPRSGEFRNFRHNESDTSSLSHDQVRAIVKDGHGVLWIGTWGGGLNCFDPSTGRFESYRHSAQNPNSLSHDYVNSLLFSDNGNLWIGTNQGLNCFDPVHKTFRRYFEKDGLPNDYIIGMLTDAEGQLWLSTNKGLSRLNPQTNTFRNYDVFDGLQSNIFNDGAFAKSRDGWLFFGGIDGFNYFDPARVQDNPYPPPIALTAFSILGHPADFEHSLATIPLVHLSYNQNFFAVEFAALDFTRPEKNRYQYQLQGVDKTWIEAGSRRYAGYPNLNGGVYIFRVKGANNDGVWNETGVSLKILVDPPPWKTWWAYALYILMLTGVIFGYVRFKTLAHEKELEQQRILVDGLRRIDKMKDEFLANTSHELRTPLNGIIGLAESLMDGATGVLPKPTRDNLQMIVGSGRRLTKLVDNILDFAKLKSQKAVVEARPQDLHHITAAVLELSRHLLGGKAVQLVNQIAPGTLVLADENRLQQILHNLVGNAIKFTESGAVTVSSALADGGYLQICISDTGIGIPKDKFARIFESFEQADGSTARLYGGTGLGLAITKELVELHGGKIWVDSEINVGSKFIFTLPPASGEIAPRPAQRSEQMMADEAGAFLQRVADNQPSSEAAAEMPVHPDAHSFSSGLKILVVDDEPVNRQVLNNTLSVLKIQVIEAEDGPSGLVAIEADLPHLVLLDVMMPRMSGFEVCRKIREKYVANDLPVIMLTAKNQAADVIEGLSCGANDYLIKPFSRTELVARLKTHLSLSNLYANLDEKVKERTRQLEGAHQKILKLEKNALEQQMAGGFAHEMRNALTGASMVVQTVIQDGKTLCEHNADLLGRAFHRVEGLITEHEWDDVVRDFQQIEENEERLDQALRIVETATNRALNVTTLIFEYSKLNTARRGKESVDPAEVLQKTLAQFKPDLDAMQIAVELDIAPIPPQQASPRHFESIFTHLIGNARDAYREVQDNRSKQLHISLREKGPNLEFQVRDNATGIKPADLERLFTPFFSTKPTNGTGLGLNYVRKLAQLYEGDISIESEVGIGATFTVTFMAQPYVKN